MRRMAWAVVIGLSGALSACGNGGGPGQADSAALSGATPASDLGVLDACRILDKDAVEQSLGAKVQSAERGAVHDGKDGADRLSQCAFSLGETGMLVFGAGESSEGTAETVPWMAGRFRGQMQQVSQSPSETLDGVGKSALWNAGLHMLYVFPADGRYYSFTLNKAGAPDQKAAAIALARKLGL